MCDTRLNLANIAILSYHIANMENFEWDEQKNQENIEKHGVSFQEAQTAFLDQNLIVFRDREHSTPEETRYFGIGLVGGKVCAVRFTYREKIIRIFGAGYWRKERKIYERETKTR